MDLVTTGAALAIANKLLGKTSEAISGDLATLYTAGRDKITEVAIRKIKNPDDGAVANLRVARDVFWNGSYTDESICAEYFGGILASSRSSDGKDDTGVFYVDIIKSLSSGQLKLHYIIYRTLNKQFLSDKTKKDLNPGQSSELNSIKILIPTKGVMEQLLGEDFGAVLHGLNNKGLIDYFQSKNHDLGGGKHLPYLEVNPTPLGIQLFAIANNMFSDWRSFSNQDFGDFPDIVIPPVSGVTMDDLLEKLGLKDEMPETSSKESE